jgi:hypothetical protein
MTPVVRKVINLAGEPTPVREMPIEISRIDLDPENPRIGLTADTAPIQLTEQRIQHTLRSRNADAYRKLSESIEINHGAIHPIWVKAIAEKGRFVAIEGNTRLVIYRELSEKYSGQDTYRSINCMVLPANVGLEKINFIRLEAHLRGTTDWDAYEKARYLYKLYRDQDLPISYLEKMTKLKYDEIETSIRAFRDMEEQYLPKYGSEDQSSIFKFSYFVEYEKDEKLKDLMEHKGMSIGDFCKWVGEGRITRAQDVRELRSILIHDASSSALQTDGFDRAMEKLEVIKPEKASPVFQLVERVTQELKRISAYEVTEMREGSQPQKKRLLEDLSEAVSLVLKMIE